MKKIMVSIIIVNFNEKHYLPKCLGSIMKMKFPYGYEVILVDNGSIDGSQEFVRRNYPKVKLIENGKNLGYTGGHNTGAKAAKGKYILCLNNDTEVARDWLTNMVSVMESDPQIGICTPKQLMGDKKTILYAGSAINYLGFAYTLNMYKKNFKQTEIEETAFASGAALMIRRDLVKKIGLFDEDYFIYHEDVDLSWRARLAGYKVIYVPTSLIYHYFKFKRRPKKMYLLERNRLVTILKNYNTKSLMLVLPMLILTEIPMIAYSAIRGWLSFKLGSYFFIVSNFGKIMAKRAKLQRLRKVSDREITKSFTSDISYAQESVALNKFASHFLKIYWFLVKKFI
ncbi:MAG: glycosyltransferase family 2 protein [Candidatus Aenigmatarchaeota archaeon]